MSDPAPKLPSRRLILMPWRWSRWTLAVVLPLMPMIYFLSAVPVKSLVVDFDRDAPEFVGVAADTFYGPAKSCATQLPVLAAIWNFECEVMLDLIDCCTYPIAVPEEVTGDDSDQ